MPRQIRKGRSGNAMTGDAPLGFLQEIIIAWARDFLWLVAARLAARGLNRRLGRIRGGIVRVANRKIRAIGMMED